MMHLKDAAQKPVVDGRGSADGSIREEEGSDGGKDCVGDGNGTVHRQVKHDI